jgi:hypothetical protein
MESSPCARWEAFGLTIQLRRFFFLHEIGRNTMSVEMFIGRKTKKAWAMKPKRRAGSPSKTQGVSGEARAKSKQATVVPAKKEKK